MKCFLYGQENKINTKIFKTFPADIGSRKSIEVSYCQMFLPYTKSRFLFCSLYLHNGSSIQKLTSQSSLNWSLLGLFIARMLLYKSVRVSGQSRYSIYILLCAERHYQPYSKLYIPSTLNIDFMLWHTKLIVFALKCKTMAYFFYFSRLYPATNIICICVSLFEFHI